MMSRMTVRLLCGKFHRCPKQRLKQRRVETVRLSQVWFRILSLVFTARCSIRNTKEAGGKGYTFHRYVRLFSVPFRDLRSAYDSSASRLLAPDSDSIAGSSAFSVFGPSTWNGHPFLRRKPSLDSFRHNLKTFLFRKL